MSLSEPRASASGSPSARADEKPPSSRRPQGTTAATKISASVGIIAAMVLATLVNVFVARHYRRWDWTRGGLYTLSDATLQTLRSLEEPIHVYILLPSSDPETISLQHLLDAYRGETSRLEVELTDPDRHPAEFIAIQQRYGIETGKTEDGRVVTDAAVVVVRGDKPYFITQRDLVEVDDEEDTRARPRLEQALTAALRSLLTNERPKACFSSGHGEKSPDLGGGSGLAPLRERLVKNNFVIADIPPVREDKQSLDDCRVLIVAGPTEKVPAEDTASYKAYLEKGGSVFLAVGPLPDAAGDRYLDLGLGDLYAAAGVKLDPDFLFELDGKLRSTQGFGETFMPVVKPHAVTDGLMKQAKEGLEVVLTVASSLTPTGGGSAAPVPLLVTSDQAFGMADFFAWAKAPSAPSAGPSDHKGPLTVAIAAELPKPLGSSLPHGGRVVAVGSSSVLVGANWQNEELRGTAVFVESAMSWLAARPVMLDIPAKPTFTAGLRLSEDQMSSIFRYVVAFIPLAAMLLGTAVYLRRRGTERRGPAVKKAKKGAARGKGKGREAP